MKCTSVLLICNEEENIVPLTEEILDVYEENHIDGEILLVDDGSTDRSYETCDDLALKYPRARAIHHSRNIGRSHAIKTGFENAGGEVVIIMDGDRQYEPKEIPRFLEKIDEGYDVVTGYRYQREDVFYRKWESWIYNRFVIRRGFGLDIRDQNSGFKAFKREGALKMDFNPEGYLGLHRFILPLAAVKGLSIAEIPIVHYARKEGRSYIKSYTVPFITLRDLRRFSKEHAQEIRRYKMGKKKGEIPKGRRF